MTRSEVGKAQPDSLLQEKQAAKPNHVQMRKCMGKSARKEKALERKRKEDFPAVQAHILAAKEAMEAANKAMGHGDPCGGSQEFGS